MYWKRRTIKLFNKIICIVTIISAFALVCSYLARYIDPKTFWPFAFAGLAYVPLLILNGFLLILNGLRRKLLAFLPLIVILTGWNLFFDTFSFRLQREDTFSRPSHSVRVFTWNIHYFQDPTEAQRPSFQKEILQLAASARADIICLQEFSAGPEDPDKGMISIRQTLNMPYAYFQPMESKDKGMIILSKYPVIRKGMIRFSDEPSGNQCLFADIVKDGKTLRVYTVHLESIRLRSDQLNYINNVVKGEERNIRPSKRIAGQLKHAFQKRSDQVKLVKDHAAKCPCPYLICGDFNDPPSSYAFYKMSEGLKKTFAEKGHGFFPVTYYEGFLQYQIDHILVSPAFEVLNHQIIKKKLSDHYPVLADVKL